MKLLYITLVILIFSQQTFAQRCAIKGSDRKDCGKIGTTQETCEQSGCCWNPNKNSSTENSLFDEILAYFLDNSANNDQDDYPYCFHPQNICQSFNFTPKNEEIFPGQWFESLYEKFTDNINVEGNGGICAAPGMSPAGSYYYHWMRDGALTMRAFMEINDNDYSKIKFNLGKYVSWVQNVQHETDPNGYNILINPKFVISTRVPYTGGWCRPQTDGPGLRSGALIKWAQIKKKNTGSIDEDLLEAIYTDLDWIVGGWKTYGCDLWEDIQSDNFFWNRMAFYQSLTWGSKLATQEGDSKRSKNYAQTAEDILPSIKAHYNGQFIQESDNRPWDGAVIHALAELNEGVFELTGKETAKTLAQLNDLFCNLFPINQIDDDNKVPGILYGRYKGDEYAGGNPWQLLTAVLAQTYYEAAQESLELNQSNLNKEKINFWRSVLYFDEQNLSSKELAVKLKDAGTSVMERLWLHVKNDKFMISEQIDKYNGEQTSAQDLTWSYANILRVLKLYTHNEEYLSKFD